MEKTKIAMESVEQYLVDRESKIIKLLAPPFHGEESFPGYIQSYMPGVRENGGQYTHGAVWSILANVKLSMVERAREYFCFLNPIEHAKTKEEAERYQVEPYVVAADVYVAPNMIGRGGWTWYTGSSSWLFIAGLEAILKVRKKANRLIVNPCLWKDWETYSVSLLIHDTPYKINVYYPEEKTAKVEKIYWNNTLASSNELPLAQDGFPHQIDFLMG